MSTRRALPVPPPEDPLGSEVGQDRLIQSSRHAESLDPACRLLLAAPLLAAPVRRALRGDGGENVDRATGFLERRRGLRGQQNLGQLLRLDPRPTVLIRLAALPGPASEDVEDQPSRAARDLRIDEEMSCRGRLAARRRLHRGAAREALDLVAQGGQL